MHCNWSISLVTFSTSIRGQNLYNTCKYFIGSIRFLYYAKFFDNCFAIEKFSGFLATTIEEWLYAFSQNFWNFCPNTFRIFIWNFFLCSTDDACQYWLNESILTSPYYPKKFLADNIGCQWTITAPEDHIIALEFKTFKVSLKTV